MRKLMWFTIGFGLICGLCAYIPDGNWHLPVLIGGLISFVAAIVASGHINALKRPAMVLFGLCMGMIWFLLFQRYYLQPVTDLDGKTVTGTITAVDYSYDTGYGTGVDGEIEISGKTYRIRIYLDDEKQIALPCSLL